MFVHKNISEFSSEKHEELRHTNVINHPPVMTIFIGGMEIPFPVMGGLWHGFTTINQ